MSRATDIRIKSAAITFEPLVYRMPIKFGGRVIDKSFLINVTVTVESRDGKKHATGFGSMPVGNVWAWPSTVLTAHQTEQAMKLMAEQVVQLAEDCVECGHPIDLSYHLSAEYDHLARKLAQQLKLAEAMPELAQLVAASPLDAALHDGFGRLHQMNSYDTLSSKFMSYDLSEYLDKQFKGEYLDRYTLREPKPRMPLYHLVGASDPLTPAELTQKVGDGLPETLLEWIPYNGLTHLKIKLAGDDFEWDLERVLDVDRVTQEAQERRQCPQWVYSLDFNEKCPHTEYVLTFLRKLEECNSAAYTRIQYIEQPTHRDLKAHPEHQMHKVSALKPVVIDESLTNYDTLLLSREMGYSGIALKVCKGHTDSLLLGAAAQKFGLFLCVQDLTCPGYSFLHSASLAARIPGVQAIEGNARQYCPGPNKFYSRQYPGMFNIQDGTVETGVLNGPGLGF